MCGPIPVPTCIKNRVQAIALGSNFVLAMPDPITISVALPGREYDVIVGERLLDSLGARLTPLLGDRKRCAIITDTNVGPLYADEVKTSLQEAGFEPEIVTVEAGEASKSMSVAETCCREMIRAGLDRSSFVVAVGGGVVGDLAGFVAAIFYRGIPFIQVPTSVVAQVDSSVGGKTGVNAPEGKNLIGAFQQPALVLADVTTLGSLSACDYNEGFAEVIKHAAIRDAGMFDAIRDARGSRDDLSLLISRNVAIKARVVEEDEKETSGTRALLNFGHTIGHAIESAAGYGGMLHGEAISLGLIAAADISVKVAGLSETSAARIREELAAYALPLTLPDGMETNDLLQRMARDKKFVDGEIRFVLLSELGDAYVSKEVGRDEIVQAIEALRS